MGVYADDIVDGPQWRNAWTDVIPWRGRLLIESVQSIWGELHFLHLYCCIWNADAYREIHSLEGEYAVGRGDY